MVECVLCKKWHKRKGKKMKANIFILENDPIQNKMLSDCIQDYSQDICIFSADSFENAIKILETKTLFHAYFIDVSMDETAENTEGLDLAIQLSTQNTKEKAPIIFVTGFPEHTYQAINTIHCFSYLLKPYTKEDIFKQLDDIFRISISKAVFSIKTLDGIYIKINYEDILYIESLGRYMHFHTINGEIKSRQYRLKELVTMLDNNFIQCHKSYIINQAHIKAVNPKEHLLVLDKLSQTIPYSQNYFEHTIWNGGLPC